VRSPWHSGSVGTFVITLLLLRIIADKVAPSNVDLPHGANLGGGLVVGAAAGTLTMGMFMIGAGHVQAPRELMGYNGVQRNDRGEIGNVDKMWFPVATLTATFYEYVSGTSMWSPNPLAKVNPELDAQATLLRDSFNNGKGQLSLPPDAARVTAAVQEARRSRVDMRFENAARDYNEQLTISQAQVRLIGNDGRVVHPTAWEQESGRYEFETRTFYATSTPGQQTADLSFFFLMPANFTPNYIQVKGTRFPIRTLTQDDVDQIGKIAVTDVSISPTAPTITSVIDVDNGIRPIRISKNNMPTGIEEQDGLLTVGDAFFPAQSVGVIRSTMQIKGIWEPVGTRVVKVKVDQDSPANIYAPALRERLPERAQVALIDTNGDVYNPIGFMHHTSDQRIRLKLDPSNFTREKRDLPVLPSSGGEDLYLIFVVTEGRTIKGMKFGDESVGRANVFVDPNI